MQIVTRMRQRMAGFAKQAIALGTFMIVSGIGIYFTGPDGPFPFTIKSPSGEILGQISVYDYTRSFFGLCLSLAGLVVIVLARKSLVQLTSRLLLRFRTLVPGTRIVVSDESLAEGARISAKVSLTILGFLVLLWAILLTSIVGVIIAYLVRNTPGVPLGTYLSLVFLLLGPIFDTIFRFAFLGLFLVVQSWLLYLFGLELLWGVLSGLISKIMTRTESANLSGLSILRWRYFSEEFGRYPSAQTVIGMLLTMIGFLAALALREFMIPLLVMTVSIIIVTFCERGVAALMRACRDLGIDAADQIKLSRRGLSARWAVIVHLPIVYLLLWRIVVLPVVLLESVYMGQSRAIAGSFPGFLGMFVEIGRYWTSSFMELGSTYLLYVMFVFAAMGSLYVYVLPEFFLARSKVKFLRKAALVSIVFLVSYASQAAISFFTPSSPSPVISLAISFLVLVIVTFSERSYSEAIST